MAQVRYFVADVEAAVGFYVDALGFRVVQQFGPAMAIIENDDLTLWLAGPGASASRPMPDGSVPGPAGGTASSSRSMTSTAPSTRCVGRGAKFRNDVVTGSGGKQSSSRTRWQRRQVFSPREHEFVASGVGRRACFGRVRTWQYPGLQAARGPDRS